MKAEVFRELGFFWTPEGCWKGSSLNSCKMRRGFWRK